VVFDIHRVAKRKFNENWALATQIHRAFDPLLLPSREPDSKKELDSKREGADLSLLLSSRSHKASPKRPSEPSFRAADDVLCSKNEFPTGSLLFVIDRVKEVLLGSTHDTEKVRRIRVLFGFEKEVKVEEGELAYRITQ
jgi:hypothetical protein